jgi:hypothetical protein
MTTSDAWTNTFDGDGRGTVQSSDAQAVWQPTASPEPFIMYGRMEGQFDPARCPQAKLTSTTVCAVCGKGFKAGDAAQAQLAVPPAEGTWRHEKCVPPAELASRYRGWGNTFTASSDGIIQSQRALDEFQSRDKRHWTEG